MEYRRRTVAGIDWGDHRRLPRAATASCPNGVDQLDYDYDDDDNVNNNKNNNSGNVSAVASVNMNDTTMLVDELEQLRTDNFQLRLRVYNAERRVDMLSASAARSRDRDHNSGGGSDSDTDSSRDSSRDSSSSSDCSEEARELAAAKATAGAAVRTVHDLLTVNRRLLSLLAAAVSAKAVAVTADDKKRWQKLRNRVDECGTSPPQIEEDKVLENRDDDGDESATSEDSETRTTTRRLDGCEEHTTEVTARHVSLRSPPPPQRHVPLHSPPPPLPPPPPDPDALDNEDDDNAGGGNGSELVRLRARCRRLERSLQQLVNTELWARNRQIGKLEQQRYVTQVQAQKERRSAAIAPQQSTPVPVTKGILVKKSPPQSPPVKEPVLPDYSEVNFFYSCDEDNDEENEDDDRENDSETNGLSSSEEETQSGNEPVKLSATVAVDAPLASSSPLIAGSQKRHRRRRRLKNDAARTAVSSSTESVAVGDLSSGATTATPTPCRRRHRVAGGGASSRRRRRCGLRLSSTCDRCAGDTTAPTADAQVQCDGTGAEDGDDQAGLLRRELEARRRENCRLYDMLLRLQRDRGSKTAAATYSSSDRDDDGSPEPYGRAARAVRGRIADLLPPLLRPSAGPTANGSTAAPQTDDDEQTALRLQQQQQLLLLARLRERIVAYERQELLGGDGNRAVDAAALPAADRENDVEHMDHAALVNVALPRAVDRLRRALVPLLQHKQQRTSPPQMENGRVAAERDSSVG